MFDDVGDNVDFRVTLDETLPVFLDLALRRDCRSGG